MQQIFQEGSARCPARSAPPVGRNHFLMLLLSFPAVSSKETQLCPGARLHCSPHPAAPCGACPPGLWKRPMPPRGQAWRKSMPGCADSTDTSRHPRLRMPRGSRESVCGSCGAGQVGSPSLIGKKDATHPRSRDRMQGCGLQATAHSDYFRKRQKSVQLILLWQEVFGDSPPTVSLPAGNRVGSGL